MNKKNPKPLLHLTDQEIMKMEGTTDLSEAIRKYVLRRKANKQEILNSYLGDDPETKKWIENLNESQFLLFRLGFEKAGSKKIKTDNRRVQSYFEAVKKLHISKPTDEDLEDATGISASTWGRHLRDPLFLATLKRETEKKTSYRWSKTPEKKAFWLEAATGVNGRIATTKFGRDAMRKGRTVPYDEGKMRGRKEFAYDDLDEVYDEEKKPKSGTKKTTKKSNDLNDEEEH
jgi:predicted CopG family antitoxin